MNDVCRKIFESLYEEKWLSIQYKNVKDEVKKYWIDIKDINVKERRLTVDGLKLSNMVIGSLNISIDRILHAVVLDSTISSKKDHLINDISLFPSKYKAMFDNVANLRVLNYLSKCNKLDSLPYTDKYKLVDYIDDNILVSQDFNLSYEQFKQIVNEFQFKSQSKSNVKVQRIAMNLLSVNTRHGLYVLAYRKLNLDVKSKKLTPDKNITLCREYAVNGEKISVLQFLDECNINLLDEFEQNAEIIKDKICQRSGTSTVNDMPYIVVVAHDNLIDLDKEYAGILKMFEDNTVTAPIKAFLGGITDRSRRRKEYPIILKDDKVNIAQLLAISKAIRNPIVYVQGPPGTGKTKTIINTILTAFFNEKSVLFSSYNNHPVDSVYAELTSLPYNFNGHGSALLPVLRLGNDDKIREAIKTMKELYKRANDIKIFKTSLDTNKQEKIEKTKLANVILAKYEDKTELEEKKDMVESLISKTDSYKFSIELQTTHKAKIEDELNLIGEIDEEKVTQYFNYDFNELYKFINFTSAEYIKKINEPKNKMLLDIIHTKNEDEQLKAFKRYLKDNDNFQKFIKIFPIILTTNLSAQKLGEPKVYFDKVIIDEAGQCDSAVSLVPIIRGSDLMLVGDPQQLKPVIVLDPRINDELKSKYGVSDDYDYINNSIYKAILTADPISDEVLLKYHYRCNEKIIAFNNKKYYNNKLIVKSHNESAEPLKIYNVESVNEDIRNTSSVEVNEIIQYIKDNPNKNIGIITPFVNQKKLIINALKDNGFDGKVMCGTVHAFQGDEKDSILFSLALSQSSTQKTYDWLKNNKELINVATSRAKDELVIYASKKDLVRLHNGEDDLYELVKYAANNGVSKVTSRVANSRALGIKPYSTETEEAFMTSLNHALSNLYLTGNKHSVEKEVAINHVFDKSEDVDDFFYTGRFDFVVYERIGKRKMPVLAIELDGREHLTDELVRIRDQKKQVLCDKHNLKLIRIPNTYARRYNHIKNILADFFAK